MNLKEFLEKGYKLCEGDTFKNIESSKVLEVNSINIDMVNTPTITDYVWEVISAKAFSEETLPEKTTWCEGEIPPVGVECEYTLNTKEPFHWHKCIFITSTEDIVYVECPHLKEDEYSWDVLQKFRPDEVTFRPILSPEEKAEKERLEAAYELYGDWCLHCEYAKFSFLDFCETIVDTKFWLGIVDKTGYRKEDK